MLLPGTRISLLLVAQISCLPGTCWASSLHLHIVFPKVGWCRGAARGLTVASSGRAQAREGQQVWD